jgi:3-dehydroquinate synthase
VGVSYDEKTGEYTLDVTQRSTCTIVTGRGILERDPPAELRDDGRRRLVVVDEGLGRVYGERLTRWLNRFGANTTVLVIKPSERTKTWTTLERILDAAVTSARLRRRDELIGIGGGRIMDLVGLAAALLRKDTPYRLIPTTLVAQIDASLALKRAINLFKKKNLIGDYHLPRAIYIDPEFLLTVPPKELRAGMAEVKKVGEVHDAPLFDLIYASGPALIAKRLAGPLQALGDRVIDMATRGTLDHLDADPFELSLRRWPDYGHTISGSLEMKTRLTHGYAVSICSGHSAALANLRGHLPDDQLDRSLGLTLSLRLPGWHQLLDDRAFVTAAVASAVETRGGDQHWPIPAGLGSCSFLEDVSANEMMEAGRLLRDRLERIRRTRKGRRS